MILSPPPLPSLSNQFKKMNTECVKNSICQILIAVFGIQEVELPEVANKNRGCPVIFEFQKNNDYLV